MSMRLAPARTSARRPAPTSVWWRGRSAVYNSRRASPARIWPPRPSASSTVSMTRWRVLRGYSCAVRYPDAPSRRPYIWVGWKGEREGERIMGLRDGQRLTAHAKRVRQGRRNPGIGLVFTAAMIALAANITTLVLLLFVYLTLRVEGRNLQVLSSRIIAFTEQGASLMSRSVLLAGIVSLSGIVIGGALLAAGATWLTHQGSARSVARSTSVRRGSAIADEAEAEASAA